MYSKDYKSEINNRLAFSYVDQIHSQCHGLQYLTNVYTRETNAGPIFALYARVMSLRSAFGGIRLVPTNDVLGGIWAALWGYSMPAFRQPAEDLILEGSERSVIRVRAGTPYSCLMLKNQRFSSLFRHYAKHHGLRKDDLAYYFTEELQNEDTPETVYLLVRLSYDHPRVGLMVGHPHRVSRFFQEFYEDRRCLDVIFRE